MTVRELLFELRRNLGTIEEDRLPEAVLNFPVIASFSYEINDREGGERKIIRTREVDSVTIEFSRDDNPAFLLLETKEE